MNSSTYLFPIFTRQAKNKKRLKVGYINDAGSVIVEPLYDEGTRFYEGLASVRVRDRWGAINSSGEFVIEPTGQSWYRFREGMASIRSGEKWGAIDRQGKVVVEPKYDLLESFREGFAVFRVGQGERSRYGFVNKKGDEIIHATFHNARGFSEGLVAVKVANLWGYLDSTGRFRITPRFVGTRPGRRGVEETRAGYFSEGLAPVWSGKGYCYVNTAGDFATEDSFDEANTFCDGRALVLQGKRYGFIDVKGQVVIAARFTMPPTFPSKWRWLGSGNIGSATSLLAVLLIRRGR
jgi:hypothetical protein